jgi:alkaline phosphatase D
MKKNYIFLIVSITIIFSYLLYACASNKKNIFSELTENLRTDSLAPFYHGVASGDPLPNSIILWTRVTPFFKEINIKVLWYLSSDSLMKNIQQEGVFITNLDRDYTVKVDVDNLESGTVYYYQFKAFEKKSIIGKTKTTSLNSDSLNFAVVSCSDYQRGFFNSYAALANEKNIEAVIHLGDYIYEYKARDFSNGIFQRLHIPDKEIVSLSDYRARYSQYKMDPDLISVHQKHPFIVIWDDHETSNNTYSYGAQNHQPELEGNFFKRISSALKAYYEWQPIREGEKPYRSFSFGNLADLIILEERLEGRTEQAVSLEDSSLFDEKRSMLGEVQLDWFLNKLNNKESKWKIIGNQVIFSYLNYGRSDFTINLDSWDGYPHEREIIANHIIDNNIKDVVFITGDTHQSWAFEVDHKPLDKNNTIQPYAYEFGTPSINSGNSDERYPNIPIQKIIDHENLITNSSINPHLKFTNSRDHGYLILNLSNEKVVASWYYVNTLMRRENSIKKEVKFEGYSKDYRLKKVL